MSLRRLARKHVRRHKLIQEQFRLLTEAMRLVVAKDEQIRQLHLEHAREMQGVVCAWLISIERPEVDLRHDLAEMEAKIGDTVARLEEHVL